MIVSPRAQVCFCSAIIHFGILRFLELRINIKPKSKWLRKCSRQQIDINKTLAEPICNRLKELSMRGRGDNNKDEAADNKQIRFGSKIYLISFYWPKSKDGRQTERERARGREMGETHRHIGQTGKKQENLAKFLASSTMFSKPATTRCEFINLFLLNQLAKSLPESGLAGRQGRDVAGADKRGKSYSQFQAMPKICLVIVSLRLTLLPICK